MMRLNRILVYKNETKGRGGRIGEKNKFHTRHAVLDMLLRREEIAAVVCKVGSDHIATVSDVEDLERGGEIVERLVEGCGANVEDTERGGEVDERLVEQYVPLNGERLERGGEVVQRLIELFIESEFGKIRREILNWLVKVVSKSQFGCFGREIVDKFVEMFLEEDGDERGG